MESKENVVIVVGAGSTYSDGLSAQRGGRLGRSYLPPLNTGFFRGCRKGDDNVTGLLKSVRESLADIYAVDPLEESNDNLEDLLVKVYCDVLSAEASGRKRRKAPREDLFMNLIRLLNARMTETTNNLEAAKTSNIGRIVSRYLSAPLFASERFAPENICLVTFNYDLHIEKNLQRLAGLKMFEKHGGQIFNFPHLYELGEDIDTTAPQGNVPEFAKTASPQAGRVLLLKLHGSLNWYSRHKSVNPPISALFNPGRDIQVTPRTDVDTDMRFVQKRSSATYPVVIPPIVGKAFVFHQRIKKIWARAQTRLRAATEAVIFGYSFPSGDRESVNMLENTIGKKGGNCRHVSVINPDPSVITRMGMIPKNKPVTIFHNAEEFLAFSRRL